MRRSKSREHWSESDDLNRVVRGANWTAARWVVFWVVLIAAIGGGGYWIKVAIAEPKGAADAHIAINSGTNRIQSQELFEGLYAKIQEYDANLAVLEAAVRRDPSNFNVTNRDALLMNCNAAVQDYNAEARKISSGKWMSKDLPYQIDQTDPAFDCKENTK